MDERSGSRPKVIFEDNEEISLNETLRPLGFIVISSIYIKVDGMIVPYYSYARTSEGYDVFIYIDNGKLPLDDELNIEVSEIYSSEQPEFAKNLARITRDISSGAVIRCLNGHCIYNHGLENKFVFVSSTDNIPQVNYSTIPIPIVRLSDILDGDSETVSGMVKKMFKIFVRERFESEEISINRTLEDIDGLKEVFKKRTNEKMDEINDAFDNDIGDENLRRLFATLDGLVSIDASIEQITRDLE